MTTERVQYIFEPLYTPSGSIGGVTIMEISRWGEMGGVALRTPGPLISTVKEKHPLRDIPS